MTKPIAIKPLIVLYFFIFLTSIPLELWLGKEVSLTYLFTGLLSPFIILFIYWLIGEL